MSALQLAQELDGLSDGAIAVDRDGIVLAANRRVAELIDMPPGGIKPGMSFLEVLLARARAGAFGPGDPLTLARRQLAAKLAASAAPVLSIGRSGQVIEVRRRELADGAFVAIYVDAAERDRLEREERNSTQRQRQILEASPAPMTITLIDDGQFVAAN